MKNMYKNSIIILFFIGARGAFFYWVKVPIRMYKASRLSWATQSCFGRTVKTGEIAVLKKPKNVLLTTNVQIYKTLKHEHHVK